MKAAAFIGGEFELRCAYPEAVRAEIRKLAKFPSKDITGEDWARRGADLSGAEWLFATWGMPRLDAGFLAAAPRLEAVFYAAGTVKGFATPEAAGRGIVVCSASEANSIPVAEYAVSAILLSLKGFWAFLRQPPERKFRAEAATVHGAFGSTVGLVSLGAIGRRVAAMLSNHDINLLAYDPHANPAAAAASGATLAGLPELFSQSDVVSLHTPWLPETENLVGRDLVLSMKPGATLVNTARGAVVHEAGLCEALALRPDLTAVLDVTHPEPPLPDSPLRFLPNAILTPHIAGSIGPEVERMGRWMADEARRHLAGKPLRHRVDYSDLSGRA